MIFMAAALLASGGARLAWQHWRPAPPPVVTTVYTWTDAGGVVHYDQDPGHGRAVAVDTRRITPLVTPRHLPDMVTGQPAAAAQPDGAGPAGADEATMKEQMVDRAVYGDAQ